ncbi:TetR/AcrR family transcriptional regulator [Secundilactobacillus kimchicus]|uniref:TetR/AcrR family transcriptional regulator n=1 Tax=Secundilactobacillus kimchicus TaxID=528209 RepID=UPI0024A7F21C|nr:TetR/AcrR family transcriptional regulator [Secundilactobacillus kimchicus]
MKLKSEALRQSILTTTTQLLISQGIEGTSTVKVAKKLDISQSNIYSYFKNKQMLLLAVFSQHQAKLITALQPLLELQLRPVQQIDALITGLIEFGLQHPQSIQLILLFRQQPQIRPILPTIQDDPFFDALFTKIEHFQQLNVIKNYNPQFLAEGVFSMVVNYLLFQTTGELTDQPLSQQDVVTLIHGFLLTGNK